MAGPQDIDAIPVTIASGGSLSSAVALGGKVLVGLVMPSGWTSADITFQASHDGGTTFGELVTSDFAAADAIAAVQIHSPAASDFIAFDPAKLRGVQSLKVRSGTSGAAVTQGADRIINLIVRPSWA